MTEDSDNRVEQLYQKLHKQEPSTILDARIKHAARQPLKRKSGIMTLRWLSAAALLVLSVGVVLRVVQETPVKQDLDEASVQMEMPERSDMPTVDEMQATAPAALAPKALSREKSGLSLSEPQRMQEKEFSATKSQVAEDAIPAKAKKERVEQEQSIEYKSTVAESVSGYLMDQPLLDTGNWCGQADLAQQHDRQVWLNRISRLKMENRLAEAQCVELLMVRYFSNSEPSDSKVME